MEFVTALRGCYGYSVGSLTRRRFTRRWRNIAEAPLEEVVQQVFSYARKVIRGVQPGGGYGGIWCRDASFIIRAMARLGLFEECLSGLTEIWSHQIQLNSNVVYGRGSPLTGFKVRRASQDDLRSWSGALATTIRGRQLEVYGSEPDVDSNALLISATCDILRSFDLGSLHSALVRVDKAMNYLFGRAGSTTMFISQNPNEDWMDTAMRSGTVLYTQAVWAKALAAYGMALEAVGRRQEGGVVLSNLQKLIGSLNQLAKEEVEGWKSGQRVYQDAVYAVQVDGIDAEVSVEVLRVLKERTRRALGPVVVDPPLGETLPLRTNAGVYQNGAFWPWVTAQEVLAKLRYGFVDEAIALFRACIPFFGLEWVEPVSGKKQGRYPFKTGIAAFLEASAELRQVLDARSSKTGA
ncbi:MAG: hypothetical protein HYU39_06180 [Thaumarchaeota archaeon]|nr:hypothetical protein [Nitrososphaerota archaeon]